MIKKGNKRIMITLDQNTLNCLDKIRSETKLSYTKILKRAFLVFIVCCMAKEENNVSGNGGKNSG